MSHVSRLLGLLGLATLTMTAALAPQAADALTPPKGGVVEVTGFTRVGLAGNSGPVVVVVKGPKATALRAALAGLPLNPSTPMCMETAVPFTVSFLPRKGARPTMVASAFDCGPGVSVVVGHSNTTLRDDCTFQSAALAALSRSRVEGTRQALPKLACSGGDN
jgi:hypothetical protein